MKKALVIHHLRSGVRDIATDAVEAAGYALDHRYPIGGDRLPSTDEGHALALVHGSLADVTKHDAPGIAEEMRWIEGWWQTGRPYLGICHGLQLAAQLLGARVGPPAHGRAEFGYYALKSHAPGVVPDDLHVFQWHYYGADLPDGAVRLASSELFPNQVVRFGPGRFGLQGHAEQPRQGQEYLRMMDPDGPRRPGAQHAEDERHLARAHSARMNSWCYNFVAGWLTEAAAGEEPSGEATCN